MSQPAVFLPRFGVLVYLAPAPDARSRERRQLGIERAASVLFAVESLEDWQDGRLLKLFRIVERPDCCSSYLARAVLECLNVLANLFGWEEIHVSARETGSVQGRDSQLVVRALLFARPVCD